MEIEHKIFEAEIKESNVKDLTVTHFISTERRDRGRDILYADGMKVEGRPVVMFQHGFNDIIGSEPIAKNLWLKRGDFKNRKGILAKTQFFPDELGQRLWQKNVEGYMPNWSVGWRPLKHEFVTEKDVEVRHVYEWELLEYSLVAVPMQPDAQTLPGKEVEQLCFKMLPESEEKYGELVAWKQVEYGEVDGVQVRVKEFWEEKPYPNFHACRLEDPGKYIRIREEKDKFGKGIYALWGIQGGNKPVELQAIRFKKDLFTVAEARAWLKAHKYTCKMFEPATGKCEKCGKDMIVKWPEDVSGENCGKTCDLDFTYEHDGDCIEEDKGAIPYHKTPLAPEGEKWDAGTEVKKAEVKDLKIMCAWFDSAKPDDKGSYKLPHHKGDGDHACVWNGVRAAAAVLMGARGGAQIGADKAAVQAHIGKHYADFDKGDPPWKKEAGIFFESFLDGLKKLSSWGEDKEIDEACVYATAKQLISELAEFFEPEEDELLDFEKDVRRWEEQLNQRLTKIENGMNDFSTQLSALSGAGKKDGGEDEPSELVIVDDEKDQETVRAAIRRIVVEVLGELTQAEIDKMKGRVK